MAERKYIRHSDTICSCVAEAVYVSLSNYYLQEFGSVFHCNVNKALLMVHSSISAFGGEKVLEPTGMFIGGRANTRMQNQVVSIEEIAMSAVKDWLRKNLHFLDVESHNKLIPKYRIGSNNLVELFQRFGETLIPLADDHIVWCRIFSLHLSGGKCHANRKIAKLKINQKIIPFYWRRCKNNES